MSSQTQIDPCATEKRQEIAFHMAFLATTNAGRKKRAHQAPDSAVPNFCRASPRYMRPELLIQDAMRHRDGTRGTGAIAF